MIIKNIQTVIVNVLKSGGADVIIDGETIYIGPDQHIKIEHIVVTHAPDGTKVAQQNSFNFKDNRLKRHGV